MGKEGDLAFLIKEVKGRSLLLLSFVIGAGFVAAGSLLWTFSDLSPLWSFAVGIIFSALFIFLALKDKSLARKKRNFIILEMLILLAVFPLAAFFSTSPYYFSTILTVLFLLLEISMLIAAYRLEREHIKIVLWVLAVATILYLLFLSILLDVLYTLIAGL
ncbi:MAG TPA: hypothetical protein VJJ53_01385 [Candidatus Nanoarchaeia archaeon]|nr:hypothetical protein [Candidatus Nanoarchaeia archaeon]